VSECFFWRSFSVGFQAETSIEVKQIGGSIDFTLFFGFEFLIIPAILSAGNAELDFLSL